MVIQSVNKLLALAIFAFAPSLALANFIECSDRVISRGVSCSEVASVCGKPDQVDDNSIYNTAIAPGAGVPYAVAASAAVI